MKYRNFFFKAVCNRRQSLLTIALCALCTFTSGMFAVQFMPHQSIWVDEATQLTGLTFSPIEVTAWLGGEKRMDIGVLNDRMPPLSYWLGWLWSKLFGLNERAMRWFGTVCVMAATAITFMSARRAFGNFPAFLAALMLGISPNIVIMAVEIRAYPLFVLTSSAVYYCLIRATLEPVQNQFWVVAMAVFGLLSSYTHFFGLLIFGGSFVAILFDRYCRGGRIRNLIILAFVFAVLSIGLVPFVRASFELGAGSTTGGRSVDQKIHGFTRQVYRVFAHPSIAVSRLALVACLLGGFAGLGFAILRTVRTGYGPATAIGILLLSGFSVICAANIFQSSFDAMSPSYNIWIIPGTALLLASGVNTMKTGLGRLSFACILLLLLAYLFGSVQLSIRGEYFAHTPYRNVANWIYRFGEDNVTVIYDKSPFPTNNVDGFIFFAVRYEFGERVVQRGLVNASPDRLARLNFAHPVPGQDISIAQLNTKYLIILRVSEANTTDIVNHIQNGFPSLSRSPLAAHVLDTGRWSIVDSNISGGFAWAEILVLERQDLVPAR